MAMSCVGRESLGPPREQLGTPSTSRWPGSRHQEMRRRRATHRPAGDANSHSRPRWSSVAAPPNGRFVLNANRREFRLAALEYGNSPLLFRRLPEMSVQGPVPGSRRVTQFRLVGGSHDSNDALGSHCRSAGPPRRDRCVRHRRLRIHGCTGPVPVGGYPIYIRCA